MACSAVVDAGEFGRWEVGPDRVMPTASLGKLFLLVETARRCEAGELSPDDLLARDGVHPVADSGLWQHLRVRRLPVEDLAVLVAAVSDNLATNVLLDRIGLAAVQDVARALGCRDSGLLDVVRDHRRPEHPPALSVGTRREYAAVMAALAEGRAVSPTVSARVMRWLRLGTDLSMVAGGLDLDPLAHTAPDTGLGLAHKTGTDAGVRADVGHVRGPVGSVTYAVLTTWDPDEGDHRQPVLAAMREVGRAIRTLVTG